MTEAVADQIRASRPDASSWVSANAGSGKTRVLTDRVARLLLAGTDPQRILCLTYTKAAAAEMQNRLFRTLGDWAMRDDVSLRAALESLGELGEAIPAARLERARTLFARALETPGGLRIQTIHAFCEALLRRFPLEAGVAPQFTVLDDRRARALREEVLDDLARASPDVCAGLARFYTGLDPDPLLIELARHREAFAEPFDPDRLAATLGVPPGLTPEALLRQTLTPADETLLAELLPLLASSSPRDRADGEKLARALAAVEPDSRLIGLEGVLLASTAPFAARAGKFPTMPVRRAIASNAGRLDDLMMRVATARPRRLALASHSRSIALNVFGRAWLAAYGGRKQALGMLDFDDMIDRAQALLEAPGTAAWVLWRLDGGLDHILLDEAQDTSPGQWRVIQAISAEFFTGAGARDVDRTIFVVGDEKQSIYSFQGAEPGEFAAKRAHYHTVLDDLGQALQYCNLLYSFRSSRPILRLVDQVFSGPAREGLDRDVEHHAHWADQPGRVELWPFLGKPERVDDGPWDEPEETPAAVDPVATLALRIAGKVAGWLSERQPLPGAKDGRAIRAGDVLVLVQSRGAIFDAVIRALKRAQVPVAGADLLRVGAELAVNDLLAVLRYAATPRDDLSLAAVLRSPIGGVSERDLFELAHGRGRTALGTVLRNADPARWPDIRALLDDLRTNADYLRPFELLTRILIRHDGRRKLVARLGTEAEDGIDALLDQALAYEQVEPPTLTGFLDWFDRDMVTVKRRSDEGVDQVRVMTVHGAKGLEAPIVILPDTAVRQDGSNPPQVLLLGDGQPAWRMPRADCPTALLDADAARRDLVRNERRRLLYVALTRARQWLIVCGAGIEASGNGNGSAESWHDLVKRAMLELDAAEEPGPDGDVLTLTQGWSGHSVAAPQAEPAAPAPPGWLAHVAPRPARAVGPLSPSLLGGDLTLTGDAFGARAEDPLAHGRAVHRLLEVLHDRPAAERPALAARLLPEAADLPGLLEDVDRILANPDLAFVFGSGSLAEVDVVAPAPFADQRMIVGRIDRLIVQPHAIHVIDFKSNQVIPNSIDQLPEGIARQLGAYHCALAPIWPGRRIELAVLWTRAARLMPVPSELALAALLRSAPLDPLGARS